MWIQNKSWWLIHVQLSPGLVSRKALLLSIISVSGRKYYTVRLQNELHKPVQIRNQTKCRYMCNCKSRATLYWRLKAIQFPLNIKMDTKWATTYWIVCMLMCSWWEYSARGYTWVTLWLLKVQGFHQLQLKCVAAHWRSTNVTVAGGMHRDTSTTSQVLDFSSSVSMQWQHK